MDNEQIKNMADSELENVSGGTATASPDDYYVVQKGDSLSAIAHRNNTSVVKLMLLNLHIKNPHLIYPGDIIRLR